jgi:hypothetical protein
VNPLAADPAQPHSDLVGTHESDPLPRHAA